MADNKVVIAFDLYGTLLSTESIAQELAKFFGVEQSKDLAASWRRYQLEYTWRINSMGLYRDFAKITRGSLQHALVEKGVSLSPTEEDMLMQAYDALHVFPEIPAALKTIGHNQSTLEAYVFSNGTLERVSASVHSSPDLGPHAGLFKELVTVDDLQVFKPDRRVYDHLVRAVGKEGRSRDVWLVTANPFDAVGAEAAGLCAAWIDRAGKGWVDRLGDVIGSIKPSIVASDVEKAVTAILQIS